MEEAEGKNKLRDSTSAEVDRKRTKIIIFMKTLGKLKNWCLREIQVLVILTESSPDGVVRVAVVHGSIRSSPVPGVRAPDEVRV